MASSLHADPVPAAAAELPVSGSLAKWLLPSFSDALFLAVLLWLFAAGGGGWVSLLADGDTGWHIRTGDWILQNGTVPHTDLFSFSKAGAPWFAWEWLSDILYSLLHSATGLKGILVLSALLIAGFGTLLFRRMIWSGATPFAALLVSLLAFGASAIHYLARPHVFTLFGVTASLWLIDADRRKPGRRIWWLLAAMPLWVNLHGGFVAMVALLVLLVAGTLAEQLLANLLDGTRINWAPVRRYGILTAGCGLLTFANPYGWHLHEHIAAYMRSDWIRANVQEFQSPVFRGESSFQFELMLFAGLATTVWLVRNRRIVPALWILFWAHSALTSMRHIPLYMIVSAPYVALALTELWKRFVEPAGKKTIRGIFASLAHDMVPGCARSSAWIAIVSLALVLLAMPFAPEAAVPWPKDFPAVKFPVTMAAKHRELLAVSRTLTMDQWGDYLIYHSYPRQRVFVDGRSDFFGPEIGDQYIRMSQGAWNWRSLMEKHAFDVVLCPIEWPLCSVLKMDAGWRLIDDDGQAVLFHKVSR